MTTHQFILFSIYAIILLILAYISKKLSKSDPVKHCQLYKNEGCNEIDGMFCSLKTCPKLQEYNENSN